MLSKFLAVLDCRCRSDRRNGVGQCITMQPALGTISKVGSYKQALVNLKLYYTTTFISYKRSCTARTSRPNSVRAFTQNAADKLAIQL